MYEWLVHVPEYDEDGVVVRRIEISQQEAWYDELRTLANPQRPDRRVVAGTFTQLLVDGDVWMTDTPAEIQDLWEVDSEMLCNNDGSMLIVGLGIGVLLNRAIVKHHMTEIDVVEMDPRVLKAVGPYYEAMAEEHGVNLRLHEADIHKWRVPRGAYWDVGFFDIWATINDDDMAEVKRLRDRFRTRLGWFGAWAQAERIGQRKRIKNKTGFY